MALRSALPTLRNTALGTSFFTNAQTPQAAASVGVAPPSTVQTPDTAISYDHPAPWMQQYQAPITDDIVFFGLNPNAPGIADYVGPSGAVYQGPVSDFYRSSYNAQTGQYVRNTNGNFVNPTKVSDQISMILSASGYTGPNANVPFSTAPAGGDYTSPAALAGSGVPQAPVVAALPAGIGTAVSGTGSTLAQGATAVTPASIIAQLASLVAPNVARNSSSVAPAVVGGTVPGNPAPGSGAAQDFGSQLLQSGASGANVPGSGPIGGTGGLITPQPTSSTGPDPLAILAVLVVVGAVFFFLLRKKGAVKDALPAES